MWMGKNGRGVYSTLEMAKTLNDFHLFHYFRGCSFLLFPAFDWRPTWTRSNALSIYRASFAFGKENARKKTEHKSCHQHTLEKCPFPSIFHDLFLTLSPTHLTVRRFLSLFAPRSATSVAKNNNSPFQFFFVCFHLDVFCLCENFSVMMIRL